MTTNNKKSRNRGSIILMVVGLLTVISLLGITFMVVSRLDANQARKIASRRTITPAAEGIIDEILRAVKADLYFHPITADLGPYGGTSTTGSDGWLQFVTFASEDSCKFLASEYLYNSQWPHITNLLDQADDNATNVATSEGYLRNADGDGAADSYLFYTGVMNSEGDKVYAAVRTMDASAWINVKTAARCDSGQLTSPICPVNVNLRDYLGSGLYDALHGVRCGGTPQSNISLYNTECALRVMSPADRTPATDPDYAPYAISSEAYLHWLKSNASTAIGPLKEAIDPSGTMNYQIRHRLTVSSTSRGLVRHPEVGVWPKDDFATLVLLDVSDDTKRQDVYKRMFAMLSELYSTSVAETSRKQMAASFVANLWAYQDSISDTSIANTGYWAFTPKNAAGSDENITAFGLVPQLVISEGYAAHFGESDNTAGSDDHKFASAFEILNVSGRSINLANYEIQELPDGEKSLTGTLSDGERVVIYSYGHGASGTAVPSDFGFPPDSTVGWIKKNDMTFIDDKTYTLVRKVGAEYVPIDSISSGNIGYGGTDMGAVKGAAPSLSSHDGLRDDDATRCKYNVAAYATFTTGHKLKEANGLTTTSINAAKGAEYGVAIAHKGSAMSSIGDCNLIYFAGPIKVGGSLTPFTKRLREAAFINNDKFPDDTARGRLNLRPASVSENGWNSGAYPDVPAAAFIGEFFTSVPPDIMRIDNATRFYGKININTAGQEVLQRLPFPTTAISSGGLSITCDAAEAARYILAYRTGGTAGSKNYATPSNSGTAPNIEHLRSVDVIQTAGDSRNGFLAVGEVAIPLADYANDLMGGNPETLAKNYGSYAYVRDAMYRAIANCITVNSDVFVANIRIQLGNAPEATPTQKWYYLAVIDRSNCMTKEDSPAVLLVTEISK